MFVTEIYRSVQGESTWAGRPCTFIRLSGCPLRCRWCDTVYGFAQGKEMSVEEIVAAAQEAKIPLVELTGGEPLAQEQTPALADALLQAGFEVMIETSGSEPIETLDPRVHIIMDLKCPGSNMSDRNLYSNIDHLKITDEVKFVVASREDFDWAMDCAKQHKLAEKCVILVSPAWGLVKPSDLVDWILESDVPSRLNIQQHKYIWDPRKKGV